MSKKDVLYVYIINGKKYVLYEDYKNQTEYKYS